MTCCVFLCLLIVVFVAVVDDVGKRKLKDKGFSTCISASFFPRMFHEKERRIKNKKARSQLKVRFDNRNLSLKDAAKPSV